MRRTPRCWVVAAWMGRFIALLGLVCSRNVEHSAAARPVMRRSLQDTICRRATSSTLLDQFGAEAMPENLSYLPPATAALSNSQMSLNLRALHSLQSAPASTDFPSTRQRPSQ